MSTLAVIATGSMLLLSASASAQTGAQLFASQCSGGCHDDVVHPKGLVYNAAGNVAIIEAVNALGMGAPGSLADHTSIAAYLDSVKPTITLAPVAHDSPGTLISLGDIIVSAALEHADWKIIAEIASISAPTKGTVTYQFRRGFALPSTVTYKPFPGQSGTDTWTYQGTGPGGATTVRTASVIIAAANPQPVANYQGLWWNAPAGSESGWGINFTHQGDTVFASWFTFDLTGKGLWLVMTATKTGDGTYTGTLFQLTGPAFDAVPFPPLGSPGGATGIVVGSGTLSFTDASNASFAYTVNGISQTKMVTRQAFGTLPTCTYSAQPNLALATNYQDLWWATPGGSESGWGVNLTHQGDTIFASWFTFDHDRTPMWLVVSAPKIAPGTYTGPLYRLTGPPFNTVPFPPLGNPGGAIGTSVGTATFTFSDGNTGTFAYTVNASTQSKSITRQLFLPPAGTVCQ